MGVHKVQSGRTYNGETEQQVIRAAELLYDSGQYKKAVERIAPVYFAALRAGRVDRLPKKVLKIFFPMPHQYLENVVRDLPDSIRRQPPEKIAEFILTEFSMMRQESKLDPYAHNRKSGAEGLGQIRPSTATWLAWVKWRMRGFNLYNAEINIKIMTAYLADMLRVRGGNRDLALASYNAGPNRVAGYIRRHHGHLDPPISSSITRKQGITS